MRGRRIGAIAVAVAAWAGAAKAQGPVPGGWADEVAYRPIGGSDPAAGVITPEEVEPFGGGFRPGGRPAPARVVNGLDPLGRAIRRNVRPRRR